MAAHPSGTVTFLFTDIEGSTKLAREHPDKWEDLRARHHTILQSAMDAHNGYVFQIIGDAFCVAFHTANDGLNAALDAQRNLQQEDWGETPIKVRMGLHTGSAELQGSDYRGYLTMAKVQRVMSVAYGGQVLLSSASTELLHSELHDGISLRDMQEHRLKGLPDPERLWQLVAPDLQQDFPPLQSLKETPNNLPVQLTSFIGREKEVGQIKDRLKKNRLVTLTGSGGIGKTRLSIQVASELMHEYPNGIWLVELAPIADPALVTQTVCAALDVTPQGNTPALHVLTEYLKPKKTLLVVDNCEHLIDASAQLCEALLHACPNVRIVASSREALGIDGENAYRVPSLSLPNPNDDLQTTEKSEAVKLFMERATATLPEFEMTEANASVVAQICQRLDGIALAIELAASRVKLLKVEQIALRLDDAFRLLTGGSRIALPRQQTLRALIDWSYNLLSDEEQTVLRCLSVFVGGWTLEAAEYVCDNPNMLDLLTHLVDKSLVVVDYEHGDEPRYYLLETIRQYAREKLTDSGEGEQVRDRHLVYFLQLAEQAEQELIGPNQVAWLNQLESELDNVRAALAWSLDCHVEAGLQLASALIKFWEAHGYHGEGSEWLSQLIKRAEGLEQTLACAKALSVQGYLIAEQGDFTRARLLAEESLTLNRKLDDKHGVAFSLFVLGYVICWHGDVLAGRALFAESLAIYRELGDKLGITETLGNLGNWGDQQAQALMEESLALCRELGHLAGIGNRLTNLGLLALERGDYTSARSYLEEGLSIHRQLGERGAVFSLFYLGELAFQQGNYEEARAYYEDSLVLSKETGRNTVALWSYIQLGYVALQQGDVKRARTLFEASRTFFSSAGPSITWILEGWASLAVAEGQQERALRLFVWADANRLATGETRSHLYHAEVDRELAIIHSQLDEKAIISISAAGRTMSTEQAVTYALKELGQ